MTKQPRIEEEKEDFCSKIDKSEQQLIPPGIFQQFGDFIALCSDIEAGTKQNELRSFLSKFGQIQFLWLEDINGLGYRQALIFFSSQEQLDNLIQNKYLNFTSLITVEQCSKQEKKISEMFLIAFYEKDPIQQKIKAQQFYEQGFIRDIHNILEQINENQIEGRIPQGRFLTLPENFHLITKFGCYLLSFVINLYPLSAKAAINYKILQQIMNLISALPLYYINDYHTEIISHLMRKSNDTSKREILANGGLQTLSRLLDHTNLKIKMDIITSMINILYTREFGLTSRTIHPLYSDAKNDGVIFQVYQNCLVHGENDFLKDYAAYILSTLLRGQEVNLKMKQPLFSHLKSLFSKEMPSDQVACMLDMLCGLAVDEGNISEIASKNFIKTVVNLSQSSDQKIHHFSLELLLRLTEKGNELENEIKNSIDILDFLKLIGDSNIQFDDQILVFLMKHSDELCK
ncbi:MAG: hypothetical protein EZS28_017555 [Streblomastix strix]|uniref:RRM domain-containing protein n=1 Tax=Streblomastix strix TaxID=222440 RepID=A0A5J4VXL1_9EUKA|nr:MAG: hypothetical protein EZS28_017555 [Streblomastix strix]